MTRSYRLAPGARIPARLVSRLREPVRRHRYRCNACGGRHNAGHCRLLCRLCGERLVKSRDLAVATCHTPACVRAMHAALRAEVAP